MHQKSSQPGPVRPEPQGRWFYGWTVVGVVALLSFAGGVATNPILGVFQVPVTEEFGWSRATFALPMAIGSLVGGIVALAIGPLMDRHGARIVMSVAVVLMGLVFVLMSQMETLWQHFALQIMARGVITSTFFLIVGVVVPKWFVTMRGRAIGIAGLGQRLGQIVFPIVIERILTVGTWRTGAMTIGITVWATALVPTALLLRRVPEDHGWLPDGAPPDLREAEHERQAQRGPREVSLTASQTLRVPAFYLIVSAVMLQSFVTTGINFHWFSYLTDNGLSGGVAVISLSLSPLAGMPASVLSGFVAEKVPTQFLMAASYVLMAVSFVILLYADTALIAYAFGITFGIAMGVMITIMQVIWADYFGRESIGAIRGLISPVHMLSNALGPLVAAVSFDRTGSYELIFTISVAMSLLAAVLIALARKPRTVQHAERPESSEAEV